jgi:hypothetical protein
MSRMVMSRQRFLRRTELLDLGPIEDFRGVLQGGSARRSPGRRHHLADLEVVAFEKLHVGW